MSKLKKSLTNKNLSPPEKQKIRNQISAQMSRLKKKEEFWNLSRTHDAFLIKFQALSEIIDRQITGQARNQLTQRLMEEMSNSEMFEPPTGASRKKNIGLSNSAGGKKGDDLQKLVYKFMNLEK